MAASEQAERFITTRPLARVFHNAKQMLKDRGYQLRRCPTDHDLVTEHIARCMDDSRPVLEATGRRGEPPGQCALVFFSDAVKLSINQFRVYLEQTEAFLQKHGPGSCVSLIVSQEGLTPATRAVMFSSHQGEHGEITFESWTRAELMLNITQHKLFPRHEPLSPRSARSLLQKYGVTPDHLYQMNRSDPAAKYYGFKTGTIVKVHRYPGLLGSMEVYRHVK